MDSPHAPASHAEQPPAKTVGQAALTPLLDTLFLLLFSVLAASDGADARSDVQEEVQLELPSVMDEGSSEGATDAEPPVVIEIDADGSTRVEPSEIPLKSPAALAAALAQVDASATFEIRAHADARHAVVVEVLHGLREAGFVDVALIAARREAGSGSGAWGGGDQ